MVLFLMIVVVPLVFTFGVRQHTTWAEGVGFVALLYQIQSFALGQLDLRYLAIHLSVCVFVLYLTVKVLEMRANR